MSQSIPDTSIRYAKRFLLSYSDELTIIYLRGNRNSNDTTAVFALYKDSAALRGLSGITYAVKVPCKKIAALSSIYATMFCELGMVQNISAIDNIDYVNNHEIISKFKAGGLKELARAPQVDIEQTVALQPDIIFTFGMGDWQKDLDKKLEQTKIPVAISVDHLEESPLARAEWIKFFAAFVDKKQLADSIFGAMEKNYIELKAIAAQTIYRPTVFNEIKFGDSWYMPGGRSFMAQLLNDAGADYLWKDDTKAGSLPLSFEQVYAKAKNADYWINLSTLRTKKELLGFEPRYSEFSAFKKGNLYNNTKITNSFGYSIYWETGMIYPNRILNDFILIFHPELSQKLKSDFFYYEKLK
ncbi:MAG TPA: ABC transporter substrate-binding protein [Bacteroidia bacterium]|nr:ABC transporter substrate-binding protein [Bacteroidia bacterium]